jgi:preprotein translocase subunit SecY
MNQVKSKNTELSKKIIFTIFILLLYKFGTFIPIPGINSDVMAQFFKSEANIFGMVNMFSGGALERMSIFALNIMPYITASIVMQLLTSMHKGLESLKKDGERGRAKINQYTRYLTIVLATFQAFGVYQALSSNNMNAFVSDSDIFFWTTLVSLVGGTIILMWFGEKITTFGVGNGISLIIFVGIVSSLPDTIIQMLDLSSKGVYSSFYIILFFVFFVLAVMFVCFFEKTQRKIKIQYPNSAMLRSSGNQDHSFLPLKINISGFIPPIFASSVLTFPVAIMQIIGVENQFFSSLLQRGGAIYMFIFSILIIFFSYFYSSIIFNSQEVATNLKKSNCFIFGVRPGIATSDYLDAIISKLTALGSIYLIIICITPELLVNAIHIPLYIGGTGVLIMVNVAIDLITQIQSYGLSSKYNSGNLRKRKLRIRA